MSMTSVSRGLKAHRHALEAELGPRFATHAGKLPSPVEVCATGLFCEPWKGEFAISTQLSLEKDGFCYLPISSMECRFFNRVPFLCNTRAS